MALFQLQVKPAGNRMLWHCAPTHLSHQACRRDLCSPDFQDYFAFASSTRTYAEQPRFPCRQGVIQASETRCWVCLSSTGHHMCDSCPLEAGIGRCRRTITAADQSAGHLHVGGGVLFTDMELRAF